MIHMSSTALSLGNIVIPGQCSQLCMFNVLATGPTDLPCVYGSTYL